MNIVKMAKKMRGQRGVSCDKNIELEQSHVLLD